MRRTLEFGGIVEAILLDGLTESQFDYVIDFCVDVKGRIRPTTGVVEGIGGEENLLMVPFASFDVCARDWAGGNFDVELPNPATDPDNYAQIRGAFVTELNRRLDELEN